MVYILCSCNAAAPTAGASQKETTARRRQRAPPREFHTCSVYAVLMHCRCWESLFSGPKHTYCISYTCVQRMHMFYSQWISSSSVFSFYLFLCLECAWHMPLM